MFNFFKVEEVIKYEFYQIPKCLFESDLYNDLSSDSKLLYGILRDRNNLSVSNNWIDKNGYVYMYLSREQAMKMLNVSDKKITSCFNELKKCNLILEKRQGLGKPNIIYLNEITDKI